MISEGFKMFRGTDVSPILLEELYFYYVVSLISSLVSASIVFSSGLTTVKHIFIAEFLYCIVFLCDRNTILFVNSVCYLLVYY